MSRQAMRTILATSLPEMTQVQHRTEHHRLDAAKDQEECKPQLVDFQEWVQRNGVEWPHGENLSEMMILRRTDSDEEEEENDEEREIEAEVENGMVAADPKKGLHRPDYDLWRPDPKESAAWTARYKDNPQGVMRRTREFSAEILNSSEHQRYLATQQVHEEQRDFELEQIDVQKKRIVEEQEKLDQERKQMMEDMNRRVQEAEEREKRAVAKVQRELEEQKKLD